MPEGGKWDAAFHKTRLECLEKFTYHENRWAAKRAAIGKG